MEQDFPHTPELESIPKLHITLPFCDFFVNPDALPQRHKEYWKKFPDSFLAEDDLRTVAQYIDSDTVVLDLGAWVGPFTLVAAASGAKHVYAFEPDPYAFQFLQDNVECNSKLQARISVQKEAVAGQSGTVGITPLKGRSFGESTTSIGSSSEGGEVPAVAVADLVRECGLEAAQKIVLKVDVEGAEKYFLEQLVAFLARSRSSFLLLLEVHPYHFTAEDSQRMETCIHALRGLATQFSIQQRRRIGDLATYSDVDSFLKGELYHPNGLFDIRIQRDAVIDG